MAGREESSKRPVLAQNTWRTATGELFQAGNRPERWAKNREMLLSPGDSWVSRSELLGTEKPGTIGGGIWSQYSSVLRSSVPT